jgi:pimeloyl-ACP methyl ester carboxylesterase
MLRRTRGLAGVVLLSVAVLAAAAMVHRQYANDMRDAHARVASRSLVAQTPCGPIEYGISGHGPSLLMVHGAGGGFDQGLELADPLARRGFTIIAPSRFGYLRTPLPSDLSPRAQAAAHVCLLDALGIDKVAAVGGSAGAPSVLQLCKDYPNRCSVMVLVVPAVFVPIPGQPPIKPSRFAELMIRTTLRSDFAFWATSRIARDSMIESILATPAEDFARASADEQNRVLTALRHIQPVSRRARGLLADATVTTAPRPFDFERIATPTLIITTENDRFGTLVGARIAARRIPGACLITWSEGGHLWVGHQSELWTVVAEFLVSDDDGGQVRYPSRSP